MKGQIEIQFNWIFVLIVGAVILAFFLMVVNNQNKRATVEEATNLIQNLDTVMNTLTRQPDTVESFPIPQADIEFTCEPGLSQYYIQGTGPVSTRYDVIFTPQKLKGSNIITWTKMFKAPFEATIFTYMANDRTLFIFMNETATEPTGTYMNELYYEMPEEFDHVVLKRADLANFHPTGYDRYVFIMHETTRTTIRTAIMNNFPHQDEAVIRSFQPTAGLDSAGTITFTTPSQEEGTNNYLGRESLWGAIFTENQESYNCTMNKARVRMRITAEVLKGRVDGLLEDHPSLTTSTCYDFLTTLQSDLDDYITALDDFPEDSTALADIIEDIKQQASDSLRGYRCPYLY